MIRIDRCVCTGRSLADLLAQARREGLDIEALMAIGRVDGGRRCGLCRPYLREALRTGQTVFHQVLVEGEPRA